MAAAWTSGTPPIERLVLLALADWANEQTGLCWPSITTIATKTGLDARTIRRCTKQLEEKGHLRREQRAGKGTRYIINRGPLDPGQTDPGLLAPTPGAERPPIHQRHTTSKKASPSKRADARPMNAIEALPELPAGVTAAQWSDFVEMRRTMERSAKKRPWTPGAAKGIITKLHAIAADGGDAGAALQRSINEGWAGVFPQEDKQHGQGIRGYQPSAALALRRRADAEIAAARASGDDPDDFGSWPALPPD